MPRICGRCGRRVWVFPWQKPLCTGTQFFNCIGIYLTLDDSHVPAQDQPQEDPPPRDMDVCSECRGLKQVITRKDWATGNHETGTCPRCGGLGVEV